MILLYQRWPYMSDWAIKLLIVIIERTLYRRNMQPVGLDAVYTNFMPMNWSSCISESYFRDQSTFSMLNESEDEDTMIYKWVLAVQAAVTFARVSNARVWNLVKSSEFECCAVKCDELSKVELFAFYSSSSQRSLCCGCWFCCCCFFWGGGGKLKFGSVSHIYLLVLVLRKKNQPSAAVTRKTEATNMPERNLVNWE